LSPIPESSLNYPSRFGFLVIKTLEDVIGKNGINALLNLAGLSIYTKN
jgi:hypothetical protein